MRKSKCITSFALAAILALSMAGCGGSSASGSSQSSASSSVAEVKEDIDNRDDFGTAYTMTAVFSIPKPSIENNTPPSTSAVIYPDITDCGQLNTFNEKYNIPKITSDKDVEYYSPLICDKEVSSVKFEGSGDDAAKAVKEITLKVGDSEVKGFLLSRPGEYKVTVGEETLPLKIKEGSYSLYLDIINEIYVPNILINQESTDFAEREDEYDINVPALVKSYMEKFKDEDKTLAAMKMDNSLYLKEYNRIRKLRGDDVLSAEDMLAKYKSTNVDENKVATSPNRRGLKERVATLRNMTLTPEQKKGPNSNNNTDNNSSSETKKDNTPGSSSAKDDKKDDKKDETKKDNTASNNTTVTGGGGSGADALALVNEYRAQYGLPPFSWGDGNVAAVRAREIVTNFSHYSASGQQCYGENICMAPNGTARQAVNQWIESPPHRQNLLDPVCTRCAIAVVESGGYWWWSMNMWK